MIFTVANTEKASRFKYQSIKSRTILKKYKNGDAFPTISL